MQHSFGASVPTVVIIPPSEAIVEGGVDNAFCVRVTISTVNVSCCMTGIPLTTVTEVSKPQYKVAPAPPSVMKLRTIMAFWLESPRHRGAPVPPSYPDTWTAPYFPNGC